uniref:Small ribosomal subunit protein uS14c n=1 Tax=Poteriospumella lacustris TaxID=1117027 RepID=A0A7S6PV31_9STRA|nr:ribosomal protein S14 [Poteriospumella lacustris]
MAKKSMLQRELKRQILVKKYASKRLKLKNSLKKSISIDEKLRISGEIQKLPKNSSKVRLKNRCWKTGRPRGYFRFFGLSRNALREMAHQGLIPGLQKSSW